MRKLLNTLYVTTEQSYLKLDGENVIMSQSGERDRRMPFTNIENIVCMNYQGCSPALMWKCAETTTGLCFVSPSGKFLARVTGETKGNVFLRKAQLKRFENEEVQIELVRGLLIAKFKNTKNLIKNYMHDYKELQKNVYICNLIQNIDDYIVRVKQETDFDTLRGIEGQVAKAYFHIFDHLLTQQKEDFKMIHRTKRPPLDPVNAMLSFLYSFCMQDITSALETVGIDPYIGFFHTLRSGRASLACDLMEEFRAFVDKFVIGLINTKQITKKDFDYEVGGAVLLNESGKRKFLTAWQEKKKETIQHPYLKEKVAIGLFPYVQANLLAQYIRGEQDCYVNLVWKF